MKKQHCLQLRNLPVTLSVTMMLVGCGGNTPSTSSQNDKDHILPISGSGLSVSLEESRTPDFLAAEPVERAAASTEQDIPPNDENLPLPLLREERYTYHHTIKDQLVFRLVNRFQVNADGIPTVINALNLLHDRAPERYAILSDAYGDPAEEQHRRYDHVLSLFDTIMRGAMGNESWHNTIHTSRFSEALEVLAQALLLQKSVEQSQDAQSPADFSKIREEFNSYLEKYGNIPIDLKKVKLKLSENSVSLSAPLVPRLLEISELSEIGEKLAMEGRDDNYFHNYIEALADACADGGLKESEYKDTSDKVMKMLQPSWYWFMDSFYHD